MYVSILIALAFLAPAAPDAPPASAEQIAELSQYFGFGPFQIYKLKSGLRQLRLADLDGDGRTDILVWNPYRSRFELFYQRQPGEPAPTPEVPEERNELPDRGDLRRENVPASYSVAAADVAELTGDKYPDIVFFGEPRELVIMPGRADGGFGAAQGIRAPDGVPRSGSLAVGDFNHDGRSDVALLGDSELQLFMQKEGGGLGQPQTLVHSITNPMLMLRSDVNGDGRDDLLITADDERYGAYVLFGEEGGLSALRPVRVARNRSITIAPPANGQGGDDIYTIDYVTGRLQHSRWGLPLKTGVAGDWPQRWYSYPLKSTGKRRPVAIGDITGDGRPDCCAADPDAAQIILFPGGSDGLGSAHAYPGLLKVTDVCIRDLDNDGSAEVLVASPTEQMVGLSRYDDGRLTFPTSIGTRGKPHVVAVDQLRRGEGPLRIAYATRDEDTWHLIVRPVDSEEGDDTHDVEIEDLPDDPAGLLWCDLDQDGRNDLLMLLRYGAPRAFLQAEDGTWSEFGGTETRAALLKEAAPPQCLRVDVTGDGVPELLMSQGNVVRALRVTDGRWSVVDQYNPETANAEITGLTALPGPPGSPTLVMYERRSHELLVQKRRDDGTYGVTATIPLEDFDLTAMATIHIGPELNPAIVLADAQRLAVIQPDDRAPTLVEQHNYTSEKDDAWLGDSIIGDLNHDGVRDVVVVDMKNAALELLTTLPDGNFAQALRFQVFQGKRFADAPDSRGQPREVLIGDVTSDGHDDLVLIVHDRLIVYPGE